MGETFRLLGIAWDVDAAREIAADREPNRVKVQDLRILLGLISHDVEWAREHADLSDPILLVPLGEGMGHVPIDGWHRIARADAESVEVLPCRVLTADEEQRVRLYGALPKVS